MSRTGGFVWGCTTCGAESRMLNAEVVRAGGDDGCRCAQDDLTTNLTGEGPVSGLVCTEMDWCGCGNPEDVDRWMITYLGSGDPDVLRITSPLDTVLAYMADGLGWTEHGGSIGGSWLTDDGRKALDNLRASVAAWDTYWNEDAQ